MFNNHLDDHLNHRRQQRPSGIFSSSYSPFGSNLSRTTSPAGSPPPSFSFQTRPTQSHSSLHNQNQGLLFDFGASAHPSSSSHQVSATTSLFGLATPLSNPHPSGSTAAINHSSRHFSRSSSSNSSHQPLPPSHHSRQIIASPVSSYATWQETRPLSSQSVLIPSSPLISSSPVHTIRHVKHPSSRPPQSHSNPSLPLTQKSPHLWDQRWPRQWGWTGVDIPVHGLRSLRDQIERSPTSSLVSKLDGLHLPHDDPSLDGLDYFAGEVLSCNFGNDRWKVEVVRGHTRRPSAPTTPTKVSHQPAPLPAVGRTLNGAIRPSTPPRLTNRTIEEHHPKLSLYLTCNEIDWQTSRSISTSILVSIKEPRIPLHSNPITDLGSHQEGWIWSTQADTYTFEKEKEVWECTTLPSLSSLLNNSRVNAFDSFLLSIQIATPAVFSVPQIPKASLIPHSVLESLESLLDDPNTSDIQIVVTEISEGLGVNHLTGIETNSEGSEGGSRHGGTRRTRTRFRKRVLYAHSSILKHRSEYFKTMLADELHGGGWAESGTRPTPSSHHSNTSDHISRSVTPALLSSVDRQLGLIKIDDFDFVSVYWLLRWLYSNRIFFEEHEDVRAQCHVGGVLASSESKTVALDLSAATITRNSSSQANPEADLDYIWGWQTHPISHFTGDGQEADGHEKSHAKNFGSGGTGNEVLKERNTSTLNQSSQSESHTSDMKASTSNPATEARLDTIPTYKTQPASTGSHDQNPGSRSPASGFSFINQTSPVVDTLKHPIDFPHPPAINQNKSAHHHSSNWLVGDPHSHPVEMKEKASAFAIYRLSHRYELKALQDLALTHLISNLDPASAFPMLLASFVFPELHAEVKAYCLANYFEILQGPELSRCYAEVGDGLWEHGGEVLLSFTMSLRPGPPLA